MQISLTRGLVGVAASRSYLPPPALDPAVLENGHFSSNWQAGGEEPCSSAYSGGLAEHALSEQVLFRAPNSPRANILDVVGVLGAPLAKALDPVKCRFWGTYVFAFTKKCSCNHSHSLHPISSYFIYRMMRHDDTQASNLNHSMARGGLLKSGFSDSQRTTTLI
jgi:hypothetical protein